MVGYYFSLIGVLSHMVQFLASAVDIIGLMAAGCGLEYLSHRCKLCHGSARELRRSALIIAREIYHNKRQLTCLCSWGTTFAADDPGERTIPGT